MVHEIFNEGKSIDFVRRFINSKIEGKHLFFLHGILYQQRDVRPNSDNTFTNMIFTLL